MCICQIQSHFVSKCEKRWYLTLIIPYTITFFWSAFFLLIYDPKGGDITTNYEKSVNIMYICVCTQPDKSLKCQIAPELK